MGTRPPNPFECLAWFAIGLAFGWVSCWMVCKELVEAAFWMKGAAW